MKTLLFAMLSVAASLSFAEDYADPERWAYTMGGFQVEDEVIGPRLGQIVATGSSSMRFWDHRIADDFAPLPIISRGFGGSNMNDVLYYLDTLVLKHQPRAVMIYEGDNDIAQGVDIDVIVETFVKTIKLIHVRNSDIRIYLLSVKPSVSRAGMWPDMVKLNQRLAGLAEQPNIYFIDVATPMLNSDGSIKRELFVSDMLHMNQQGYDIWRDTVVPFVSQIEAEFTPN